MRYMLPLFLALMLLAPACVTDSGKVQQLQAQLDRESAQVQELSRRVEILSQSMNSSRQPQANLVNEMHTLRQEVARLNGRVEEVQASGRSAANNAASADSAQLRTIENRLAYLERYLGISAAPTGGTAGTTSSGTPVISNTTETPPPDPNADPQTIFDAGVRLFKQNSFDAAQDRFETLLKNYPNHKLAESAQFWLGETLYADRKYEEAILAYNQLIKRYPNSKSLLPAQLKQGMSFAELGDTQAAKILFNKIISASPNSGEAKTAKEQLDKLPK